MHRHLSSGTVRFLLPVSFLRKQPPPSQSHFSAAASFITFITHFRSHLATFWTFCHLLSHTRIDAGRASFFPEGGEGRESCPGHSKVRVRPPCVSASESTRVHEIFAEDETHDERRRGASPSSAIIIKPRPHKYGKKCTRPLSSRAFIKQVELRPFRASCTKFYSAAA